MDIFGYSFFVSFILAPLPGLLVSFLKRFNDKKASEWSLSFLIILDTILCALGLKKKQNATKKRSLPVGLTCYFVFSFVPNVYRGFKSCQCNFPVFCFLNSQDIFLHR